VTVLTTPSRLTPDQISGAVAAAQSYADYAADMPLNRDALNANYDAVALTSEDLAAIGTIRQPLRLFAIVEEWCPDVIANLPIFARISEANPAVSLHVLYRPDHRPIADAYPGPVTNRSHIPTYVLFDAQDRELGVLIERPAAITEIVKPFAEGVQAEIASRFPGVDRADLPPEFLASITARALELRDEHRDLERAGVVEWLVASASAET